MNVARKVSNSPEEANEILCSKREVSRYLKGLRSFGEG